MAKERSIRIYPDGNVWVVKKDGATKASAIKNTKKDAYQAARDIALNQGLSIIIHGKDGKIQRKVWPEDSENDGCFITTACVKYYGLGDHCFELETLRKYRDSYLMSSKTNKLLINQYYKEAPRLVSLLEKDKKRDKLFSLIFNKITLACRLIENNKYEEAKETYINAINLLLKHFQLK